MRYITLILLVLTTSCAITLPVQLKFEKQNKESLLSYLQQKGYAVEEEDIAVLKGIDTFIQYHDTDKLFIPGAHFFNKDGYLIPGFNGTGCAQAIGNINEISTSASKSDESISDWITGYNFFSNNDISKGYDAYVIINWAMYTDRMNKTSYNWYKSLKDNKELNIKIIFLNLDIQEGWELSEAQNDVFGL